MLLHRGEHQDEVDCWIGQNFAVVRCEGVESVALPGIVPLALNRVADDGDVDPLPRNVHPLHVRDVLLRDAATADDTDPNRVAPEALSARRPSRLNHHGGLLLHLSTRENQVSITLIGGPAAATD